MDTIPPIQGTQSLRRALQLLRLLGEHQEDGLNLTDIVRRSGLERSTAHRLLSCLVEERYAAKDAGYKTYRLGVEAMQLGVASMKKVPLVSDYLAFMKKLARVTGETIFLQIQEGDYGVCLHREEGSAPVKVFTIGVGGRRLLGIGAGGLAMLANLDDAVIDSILQRNQQAYAQAGLTRDTLLQAVAQTRRHGYSQIRDTTTTGVSGIGFAFRASKSSVASISLGAITPRLPDSRKQALATEILAHLRELSDITATGMRQAATEKDSTIAFM